MENPDKEFCRQHAACMMEANFKTEKFIHARSISINKIDGSESVPKGKQKRYF